jgi:hypothetical protein
VDCTLAAGKGALFSEGMIVRIDSEELYISNILNDTLTFQRAADGTTGAAHSAGVIIYLVTNVAYSTRSYAVIGSVIGGSAQTFAVNLNVQAGDYIGMSASSDDNGTMKTSTGGSGLYYAFGDNIPCTNYEFSLFQNRKLSLYGAGEAIVVPVSTNPAAPIINIYPFVFVAFIIVGVLLLGIMAAAEHPLYVTILLIGIYIIVGLALLTGLQPLINAM